jgi:hypothetical protein
MTPRCSSESAAGYGVLGECRENSFTYQIIEIIEKIVVFLTRAIDIERYSSSEGATLCKAQVWIFSLKIDATPAAQLRLLASRFGPLVRCADLKIGVTYPQTKSPLIVVGHYNHSAFLRDPRPIGQFATSQD